MKRYVSLYFVIFLGLSLAQLSCSSGGDSESSGTNDDSVTVSSLTTIPNLDLSNVDTASASTSAPVSLLAASVVGDNSTAGCEVVQFYKPMVLSRLKSAEALKCYIEQTQEGAKTDADTANDVDIPTDAFGYYQIDLGDIEEDAEGDEPGETTVVRVRLGNFVQDGVTTLKMDFCQSADDDSYSQSLAFEISGNTDTKTWAGHVIEQLSDPEDRDFSRNNFTYVMNSASAMEEDFDFTNVSTAEAQSYSADNADTETPTDDTNYDGLYLLTFAYDSASGRNSVTGSSNNPGENESLIYSIFTATTGAAHSDVSSTDGFEFEGTEAFDPTADPITVIDSLEVSFFADVEAATLPELIDAAEMANQVGFSDEWDCEAPSGSNMLEVDGTSFDYNSCVQLTEEADEMGDADSSECYN